MALAALGRVRAARSDKKGAAASGPSLFNGDPTLPNRSARTDRPGIGVRITARSEVVRLRAVRVAPHVPTDNRTIRARVRRHIVTV